MIFAALGFFVLVIVAALAYSHATVDRLRSANWQEMVNALERIPSKDLEQIALDHLSPSSGQQFDPAQMWELIGGMEGLKRMRRNADLMIYLAAYVRRWNYDHAIIVSERLRHDSILLKRALFRIQWTTFLRKSRVPFYVCEAASSYYLMTQRILRLYEAHQFVLYPQLAKAL